MSLLAPDIAHHRGYIPYVHHCRFLAAWMLGFSKDDRWRLAIYLFFGLQHVNQVELLPGRSLWWSTHSPGSCPACNAVIMPSTHKDLSRWLELPMPQGCLYGWHCYSVIPSLSNTSEAEASGMRPSVNHDHMSLASNQIDRVSLTLLTIAHHCRFRIEHEGMWGLLPLPRDLILNKLLGERTRLWTGPRLPILS